MKIKIFIFNSILVMFFYHLAYANDQVDFLNYMAYHKNDYVNSFTKVQYEYELIYYSSPNLLKNNKVIYRLYNIDEWKYLYSAKTVGDLVKSLKNKYKPKVEWFELRHYDFISKAYVYNGVFILDKNRELDIFISFNMPITKSKVNIKYFRKHCYKIKEFDILPKIIIK